jgi:CHAD domain-containing protein
MPYKLDSKDTVPENMKRIVEEQIDRAISELTDKELDRLVAIHQARKRIKKIRGLLRLARNELGDLYAYENLLFRDAARKLSDIRDAQAAVETFEKLSQSHPARFAAGGAFRTARMGLEKRRQTVIGNKSYMDRLVAEVVEALRQARKRLKSWPLTTDHYSAMATGHRKTYRQARRLFGQSLQALSPENLHELRKALKYHWYHGRLFSGVRTKWMRRYNASVKRMTDLLGEHRDMTVLRIMLLKHPERYGTYHEVRELLKLIDRRQRQLWEAAEPLGNLIFLERPKHIEKSMLEEWENWKNAREKGTQSNVDVELQEAHLRGNALPEESETMKEGVASIAAEVPTRDGKPVREPENS